MDKLQLLGPMTTPHKARHGVLLGALEHLALAQFGDPMG
jgi:hypothetical protein